MSTSLRLPLSDQFILVTEVGNHIGTNVALTLARHNVSVVCASSVIKDTGGLCCGIETLGVEKLFNKKIHNLPRINRRSLEELSKNVGYVRAVVVIDPGTGSKKALSNAKLWSQAFSPVVLENGGVLACCHKSIAKDVLLWHRFLEERYKSTTPVPRHNILCFGKSPKQARYCNIHTSQTEETLLNSLFGIGPITTTVEFMKTRS